MLKIIFILLSMSSFFKLEKIIPSLIMFEAILMVFYLILFFFSSLKILIFFLLTLSVLSALFGLSISIFILRYYGKDMIKSFFW